MLDNSAGLSRNVPVATPPIEDEPVGTESGSTLDAVFLIGIGIDYMSGSARAEP